MITSLIRVMGLVLVAVAAASSTACASRSINQVLADPTRYQSKQVKLSGSVVDSYSMLGRGAYQLDDNTGRLWIVSDNGVPRKGARVSVKGTVRDGFNLGSLGERMKLPPAMSSGIVVIESSHKAK